MDGFWVVTSKSIQVNEDMGVHQLLLCMSMLISSLKRQQHPATESDNRL
jgi:hypothetical protein